jgi:hypothetical protein
VKIPKALIDGAPLIVALGWLLIIESERSKQRESANGPPTKAPKPDGWAYYAGTVTPEMQRMATAALSHEIGEVVEGGTLDGMHWRVLVEWHPPYPANVPNKPHDWHKGASVIWRVI